jgi:hypothetical protein
MRMWGKQNPSTTLGVYKLVYQLWKTVCRVLKKLKIETPSDSEILVLDIYPKEMK